MRAIRRAVSADLEALTDLALELWPDNTRENLLEAFTELLKDSDTAAVFLARVSAIPAGFAQCQLRCDYVEGTQSSPVGYLEGIFVREEFRNTGLAKMLLQECESWARKQGCSEFASDCELDNQSSLGFHLAVGFQEANRIICFTKKL